MRYEMKAAGLFNDLERVVKVRHQIAFRLNIIAQTLIKAESDGERTSGKLGLEGEIERLSVASKSLQQGVFRLLVLGDMKRGKSTFLNALLGQNLLPCDVSPCTALLTVLKYGPVEKVTIHYKDGKLPEEINFQQFQEKYTIDPEEAKVLEKGKHLAFPDVSHAVIEHPSPLLGKGIEFVDSPGLNDTEARNELSLNYIYNCHAILFVMSASQPCTLEERRYLENYLKDRGLTIFFLINAWDRVREELINPEDTEALNTAQQRLRSCFRSNLAVYCQENGRDIYQKRVFEISALNALRIRLKNSEADLQETGFSEFLKALNQFLTQERATAEWEQAQACARQACDRFCEAMERRIPLLDTTVVQLKQKIASVECDFDKLSAIGRQFQEEIRTVRDRQSKETVDSFKTYILNLENSFEQDFINAQPNLDFMQFLDKNNRALFYTSFKRAFERYMNDRLAAWEFMAKQEIAASFSELDAKAAAYSVEYAQVIEAINNKLLNGFYTVGHTYQPGRASIWADTVMNVFSSMPDNLNGAIRSFNTFWQGVFYYACVIIVINVIGLLFTSLTLSFFGAILAGMGVVSLQAEYVRRQFIDATKKEFSKYLPQIAQEQGQPISQAVKKCFDVYEKQVEERVKSDIQLRKAELDNLLKQKQSHEINREAEIHRLKSLYKEISSQLQQIQAVRDSVC